jgi:hypothetical protein
VGVCATFAKRSLWNFRECLDQSGLMFAVRTTLAHFSVSSSMNFPKAVAAR